MLWGAYVRASLSGDGCGDHWPLCNGVVLPVEPSSKTIIELTHRITSGVCWIWILAMWLVARGLFARGHATRAAAGWSLFFMTTEALVGAGQHVWFDKPAGCNWEQWQRVVAEAEKKELLVQMGGDPW